MADETSAPKTKAVTRKRTSPLPDEIKKSRVATKKRVTKGNVKKYLEDMMLCFTPSVSFEFWKSLRQKVIDGDREAMKLSAQIMGYVQPTGPSVNVVTNIANSNNIAANTYDRSIDSVIRQLDTQGQDVVDVIPR